MTIKDIKSTMKENVIMMNEFEIRVGLIKGRHEMPVCNYIFDEPIEDVTDYHKIEEHILKFVKTEVGVHTTYFGTAVNAVTAALIRVCLMYGVRLTLMHYNTACDDYKPQVIW